jgi:hypothetical protein
MKKDKKSGLRKLGETLLKKGLPLLGSIVTGGASDRIINLVKGATGILDDDPEAIEQHDGWSRIHVEGCVSSRYLG